VKKSKTIIYKIRYSADNPMGRELDAFFQRSKGKNLDEEFKVAAIKRLVLNPDWTSAKIKQRGKEVPILVEYIRQRAAENDRNFFVRLGRALEPSKKKEYGNIEIEDFLFKFWDKAVPNGELGLKHFTDQAVTELLEIKFGERAPSLEAYRLIRKATLLPSERPPKIRQVKLGRDGSSVCALPRREK
jgi:hypothetical protein